MPPNVSSSPQLCAHVSVCMRVCLGLTGGQEHLDDIYVIYLYFCCGFKMSAATTKQQPRTEREHFPALCVLAAPDQEILLNNSSGKTTVGSPELRFPPCMQTVLPHPTDSGCLKWFQNAPEGAASFKKWCRNQLHCCWQLFFTTDYSFIFQYSQIYCDLLIIVIQ